MLASTPVMTMKNHDHNNYKKDRDPYKYNKELRRQGD